MTTDDQWFGNMWPVFLYIIRKINWGSLCTKKKKMQFTYEKTLKLLTLFSGN